MQARCSALAASHASGLGPASSSRQTRDHSPVRRWSLCCRCAPQSPACTLSGCAELVHAERSCSHPHPRFDPPRLPAVVTCLGDFPAPPGTEPTWARSHGGRLISTSGLPPLSDRSKDMLTAYQVSLTLQWEPRCCVTVCTLTKWIFSLSHV